MTYPHREFNYDHTPLAYLITFRSYGTWLHGREGSIDRFHNKYGSPKLPADGKRWQYNRNLLKQPPVKLNAKRRAAVEAAIRETCQIRKWLLWAFNIRTNHVHTVVSALCSPEVVLNAFKANATRTMREKGCWDSDRSPWAFRGSKRRLWNNEELMNAIAYVMYDQGLPLP
jgi:REP element-mobilizing transposase RayT